MPDSSHGRITPISLHLVYKEDEYNYNYNYYMMYKNQRYDLDDANEEAKQDTWNLIILKGLIMSKNVETIENVIEDESHFIMKALEAEDVVAMVGEEAPWPEEEGVDLPSVRLIRMMVKVEEDLVLGGRSSRESKSACGEVGGVEKMSSTGSKLMVIGEECLEGCVSAGGGEVSGGGDDFGVSKSLLGEILGVMIG
ncbi:hypothetical protein Tco_0732918 [Tanacetum coccineum]